jgi:hypothetical protein
MEKFILVMLSGRILTAVSFIGLYLLTNSGSDGLGKSDNFGLSIGDFRLTINPKIPNLKSKI